MELVRERCRAMGSPCELQLWAASRAAAQPLLAAARAEVERLEAKYSRYRPESLLSRINASAGDAAGVEVDEETARLLDYARTCFETSGGLFDPFLAELGLPHVYLTRDGVTGGTLAPARHDPADAEGGRRGRKGGGYMSFSGRAITREG